MKLFLVGAGSAGCVVANRLAADSSKTGRFHNMKKKILIILFSSTYRIRTKFKVEFSSSASLGRNLEFNETIFYLVRFFKII